MFDHERSLVERYQGRPFVLLGVDGDSDRATLQKTQKKHDLNWRSWWDEGGAIADQWSVRAYPTLFLLDHKGVVQWKGVNVPNYKQLDERIEKMVNEAESEAGKHADLSRR